MRRLSIVLLFAYILVSCSPVEVEKPFATERPIVTLTEQQRSVLPSATKEPTVTPLPVVTDEPIETETLTAPPVKLVLWITEDIPALQYVQSLTLAYSDLYPEVTFEVVNKQNETLREDFQKASRNSVPPDILWTGSDDTAYFVEKKLIQPVDDLFDLSLYVDNALEAATVDGDRWGVPVSNGNHLMLYYNKSLVPVPPSNTDEMFDIAKRITDSTSGIYGLVFDQTSPLWVLPWLGSFGGAILAEDGITPTLNTREMIATLQFLQDLKIIEEVLPAESDSLLSDNLFQEGKAGMIINRDWELNGYKDVLGEKLGIAPLPQMVASGLWPTSFTIGKFIMLSSGLKGSRLDLVRDFIIYATNVENQLEMVTGIGRLPANKAALGNELITADPFLDIAAQQMARGIPLPTGSEMRCALDSMHTEIQVVLNGLTTPEDAANGMQTAAESCIAALE
jgi:arabinogalactan oligomer/maltooligosaccharide transport system substrate-binding protein